MYKIYTATKFFFWLHFKIKIPKYLFSIQNYYFLFECYIHPLPLTQHLKRK